MKSAYELAMERLEKTSGATKKLSDEEKGKIAEIDRIYKAKIAECKLGFEQQIEALTDFEQLESLKAKMAEELRGLNAKWEEKKEAIWGSE